MNWIAFLAVVVPALMGALLLLGCLYLAGQADARMPAPPQSK